MSDASQLTANARSSVHPFSYHAPLTGHIDASEADGRFDMTAPVTALLEVDLEQLYGDDPKTDGEMRRRIDVQRYPRARAIVEHVSLGGGDDYQLQGALTIRGQTHPLEGDARVTLADGRLQAAGSVTIDLRDFGIKPPSLFLLRVHPTVELVITLVADRSSDD